MDYLDILKKISSIAHHGGLIGYTDPLEALNEIRKLSVDFWDKEECNKLQKGYLRNG